MAKVLGRHGWRGKRRRAPLIVGNWGIGAGWVGTLKDPLLIRRYCGLLATVRCLCAAGGICGRPVDGGKLVVVGEGGIEINIVRE